MMNSGHFFNPCRFLYTGFYSPDLRHQDGVKIATLPLVTKCSLVPYLRDRICGAPDLHRLADRIADQARARALDASWPERAPRPAWQTVRVQSWQR
jgi:hypothetical protein